MKEYDSSLIKTDYLAISTDSSVVSENKNTNYENLTNNNNTSQNSNFNGFCFFVFILIIKVFFVFSIVTINNTEVIFKDKRNFLSSEKIYLFNDLGYAFFTALFVVLITSSVILSILRKSNITDSRVGNNNLSNTNTEDNFITDMDNTLEDYLSKINLNKNNFNELVTQILKDTCNICFPNEKALLQNSDNYTSDKTMIILNRIIRTHHCFECDSCIKAYDHHCNLINKCLGEKGMFLFTLYLFSEQINLGLSLRTMIYIVHRYVEIKQDYLSIPYVLYLLTFIISFFFLVVSYLSLYYFSLILTNQTSFEKGSCLSKSVEIKNTKIQDENQLYNNNKGVINIYKSFKRKIFGTLPGYYTYLPFDMGIVNNLKFYFNKAFNSQDNASIIDQEILIKTFLLNLTRVNPRFNILENKYIKC